MGYINKTLFLLSSGMLIPVILALLLLFFRSLGHIGSFFGHAVTRIKYRKKLTGLIANIEDCNTKEINLEEYYTGGGDFSGFLKKLDQENNSQLKNAKILADAEVCFEKECEKSKILMRIGPMLGLMGTLIPMGPALAGLASGDLASLSHNMQVAFSTTVLGVFCGIVGFIINSIKKRWYAEDLMTLNYINEALYAEEKEYV